MDIPVPAQPSHLELERRIHHVEANLEFFHAKFNTAASLFQYCCSQLKPVQNSDDCASSLASSKALSATYRPMAKDALTEMEAHVKGFENASIEGAKLLEERNGIEGAEKFVFYDPDHQTRRLQEMALRLEEYGEELPGEKSTG